MEIRNNVRKVLIEMLWRGSSKSCTDPNLFRKTLKFEHFGLEDGSLCDVRHAGKRIDGSFVHPDFSQKIFERWVRRDQASDEASTFSDVGKDENKLDMGVIDEDE